ncbi:MAG: prephenate dehydrogenase [Clostridia bacterium]|nr:prephenate dehydrogenase [Clostridia bacterium]
MNETIGIVGLGLIGGSMARAYKLAGWSVLGADLDQTTLGYAVIANIINRPLDDTNISKCDVLMLALYPQATITWLQNNASKIPSTCTVIDLCGTKKSVCEAGFALAKEHGFLFVGGHPMAGTQFSGIKYSRSNLFKGAPMVIVPPVYDDIALLDRIKKLLAPAGFGQISVTTAEKHDRMIAFTSQLAHVVSNAYIKSPTAAQHGGFSAGSYKDMTRVAWLNEEMWTQLFIENSDALTDELDVLIQSLTQYRNSIASHDADTLKSLLRDGRIAKETIDGNGAKK